MCREVVSDRGEDGLRILARNEPAGDLGRGRGRDHGLGAGSRIAARNAVELERRLQPLAHQEVPARRPWLRAEGTDLGEITVGVVPRLFDRLENGRVGRHDPVMETRDHYPAVGIVQARQ